ncbi:hemagglutinin [Mycoplasmopsis synoviae]|nr:hemagglutinin [Mycoplasmopsis synoviae]
MPKIVLEGFDKTWEQNSEENERKIRKWFDNAANWVGLSDQLTKKLGAERFKNVKLTYKEVTFSTNAIKTPTVTFTVEAQDGYTLTTGDNASATEISLVVRVLYNRGSENVIQLPTQGASSSAAPAGSTPSNNAAVIRDVNVYMNYTGPSIVLDEAHPTVGATPNTSINGTSNVIGDFNTKFKKLLVNVLSGGSFTQTSLLQAIINYVNKFDPKFPASFVLKTNGVAIASVQNNTQLRIGSLNDFLYNNKGFLQQVNTDTKAVYFAVNGVTSQGWLNTFLIRIPLTKFVKPLIEFRPTTPTNTSSDTQQQDTQQQGTAQTQSNQGS